MQSFSEIIGADLHVHEKAMLIFWKMYKNISNCRLLDFFIQYA